MDLIGCGGGESAQGRGGDDKEQGYQGGDGLKRKWSDLEIETSMKAVMDSVVKANAEKSAKIRRLMAEEKNVRLEETGIHLENSSSIEGPIGRPLPHPNPFAVFPVEVWEMIIEKMNRLSDLEMLCLAFRQLEPLVKKKKKTLFLFEKVVPLVWTHLGWNNIINSRLVCQKWNRDVSTLLANWKSPNLLPETSQTTVPDCPLSPPPFLKKAAYSYSFEFHWKIERFLKKMEDHPGNPMLGRFLSLSVNDLTKLKLFWNSVHELVKNFGEHVWNVEIRFSLTGTDPIGFYNALQKTLSYLPNLRYLTVDCYFNFNGQGQSKTDVEAQIGSCPLPTLPYLQSLTLIMIGDTGLMSAFSQFFSKQLRQLELIGNIFGSVDLKDEWLHRLISLGHLKVELASKEAMLRILQIPSPNLTKLYYWFENYHSVSLTSELIGNLLDKFSRLDHLHVGHCWKIERSSSSLISEIKFSGMKTLGIVVDVKKDDLLQNLDFVLWFPSLKHLKVTTTERLSIGGSPLDLDEHSTLKIRKFLYTRKMTDSNVWTLVPSLESLEIWGHGKYTRDMWENRVGWDDGSLGDLIPLFF